MDIVISNQVDPFEESFSEIERILRTNLSPVTPRGQYIHSLKQRLDTSFPPIREPQNITEALLLIGGIISGITLIIIGIRLLSILLSALGLIKQYRKKINN